MTPYTYDSVRFPRTTKKCPFPFLGCPGSSCMRNGLHYHFNRQHWGDCIRILEEHPKPLPRCERCGSQVSAGRLSKCHYKLEKYKKGEEKRLRCKTQQLCFETSRVLLNINAKNLPSLETFPYLGRTIAYNNSH